jgi:glycosyltransferase involved in cell wall biosynthesis
MSRIAIFTRSLGGGGTQRVLVTLAHGFVQHGHDVDVVLVRARGEFLSELPSEARVIDLRVRSMLSGLPAFFRHPIQAWQLAPAILRPRKPSSTYGSLSRLARYLRDERPDALLTARATCNTAAVWARAVAGVSTRLVIREGNVLGVRAEDAQELTSMRRFYTQADRIVAVSDGVGDELAAALNVPRERVETLYNPVRAGARAEDHPVPDHPWFKDDVPVLLGVGRLHPQKDFPTLIRAFARVRAQRPCRLMILGRGDERERLEALVAELGLDDDVALPGFASDVFSHMAHASVFVLSSGWEGLPNALLEALACGCPVVSTDCPSGPSEILKGGTVAPLVPVGDHEAMAAAIAQVLDEPPAKAAMRARADDFSPERVAERYLEVLLG